MKYSLCIGAYEGKDVIYHLEKIKSHGFHGLEYYNWWDLDLHDIAREQERIGVGISATCTSFFNLVDSGQRERYVQGIKDTIVACSILGAKSIITQTGNVIEDIPRDKQRETMIETLKICAPLCEEAGVTLEIEPMNGLVDHRGHFLQYSDEAVSILEQVNSPNVKLVFDVYHQQITEGNVIRNATGFSDYINHYHIADNPGRQQPGTGELNYVNILKAIKDTGYTGFIGLECGYTIDPDEAIDHFKQSIVSRVEC
ncbi:xylose isomerase [Virgibacillus profundi]|uniref:Xylose isomerase n=1 Tax=Virgibacillus profundi TaxID=2024555 RepID=A0A2A2IJB5_9BACI|nr:TIM barrel protein [Virgibacillus profundi]PAV31185.1 xylose isomerase [Virgibacillus profundi]PXY55367.1 xylose isomerase [Virgibacillus profundi]